jgi:hypothetical protein
MEIFFEDAWPEIPSSHDHVVLIGSKSMVDLNVSTGGGSTTPVFSMANL